MAGKLYAKVHKINVPFPDIEEYIKKVVNATHIDEETGERVKTYFIVDRNICKKPRWSEDKSYIVECEPDARTKSIYVMYDLYCLALMTKNLNKSGAKLEVGDWVENSGVPKYGYGTNGLYAIDTKYDPKSKKHVNLVVDVYKNFDDSGSHPKALEVGPKFPVGYWTHAFVNGGFDKIQKTGDYFWEHLRLTTKMINNGRIWGNYYLVKHPWGKLAFDLTGESNNKKVYTIVMVKDFIRRHELAEYFGYVEDDVLYLDWKNPIY